MSISLVDDGNPQKYFAMVPHIDDFDLDVYEYRLMGHFRHVCGHGGVCTESTRTLAAKLGMSEGTISKARKRLCEKGRITIEADPQNQRSFTVRLVDVWSENVARCKEHFKGGRVHHMNGTCSPHERGRVHVVNGLNNIYTKSLPESGEEKTKEEKKERESSNGRIPSTPPQRAAKGQAQAPQPPATISPTPLGVSLSIGDTVELIAANGKPTAVLGKVVSISDDTASVRVSSPYPMTRVFQTSALVKVAPEAVECFDSGRLDDLIKALKTFVSGAGNYRAIKNVAQQLIGENASAEQVMRFATFWKSESSPFTSTAAARRPWPSQVYAHWSEFLEWDGKNHPRPASAAPVVMPPASPTCPMCNGSGMVNRNGTPDYCDCRLSTKGAA